MHCKLCIPCSMISCLWRGMISRTICKQPLKNLGSIMTSPMSLWRARIKVSRRTRWFFQPAVPSSKSCWNFIHTLSHWYRSVTNSNCWLCLSRRGKCFSETIVSSPSWRASAEGTRWKHRPFFVIIFDFRINIRWAKFRISKGIFFSKRNDNKFGS